MNPDQNNNLFVYFKSVIDWNYTVLLNFLKQDRKFNNLTVIESR